jgi:hypothetical protein
MAERGLLDIEQGNEIAYAHLACVLTKHIDELQSDWVTQCVTDRSEALRLATF